MHATVHRKEGSFFIQEAVTFETVSTLQNNLIRMMRDASLPSCTLNFEGVKEVNSAALGLLVELKKYSIAQKKEIQFLNLPERLLSLAHLYGIAGFLKLV